MKIPAGTQHIKSGSFSHQTESSWHSLDSSWMHQAFAPWLQGSMGQGEQACGAGWGLAVQPVLPHRHPADRGGARVCARCVHGGFSGGCTGGCTHGHTGRHPGGYAGEYTGRHTGRVHGGCAGPSAALSGRLWHSAGATTLATQTGAALPPSAARYPLRHPAATAGPAAPSAPTTASAGAYPRNPLPCLREAAGGAAGGCCRGDTGQPPCLCPRPANMAAAPARAGSGGR